MNALGWAIFSNVLYEAFLEVPPAACHLQPVGIECQLCVGGKVRVVEEGFPHCPPGRGLGGQAICHRGRHYRVI